MTAGSLTGVPMARALRVRAPAYKASGWRANVASARRHEKGLRPQSANFDVDGHRG
jgi:hypothetical protein